MSQVIAVTKPGCPACEETKPVLKKLKKRVTFAEINADDHPSVLQKLGTEAFPDIVYTNKQGKVYHMPWQGIPEVTNVVRWIDEAKAGAAVENPEAKNKCLECGYNGQGVSPKIWGPPVWFIIHMVALMYPRNPSASERKKITDFFYGLQKVLPCEYCKKHYAKELERLDPDTFRNRDTLFEWTVRFHDAVSDRTHSTQPRHTVNYWRKYYKAMVMSTITHLKQRR